jgi:hypothetical protein
MIRRTTQLLVGFALATTAITAQAQTLANRVAASGDRAVQFSYPARAGVCGDGRTYISTSPGSFYGTYSTTGSDRCAAGPVRVVLDLADRNVIAVRTFVGGTADAGVSDLGTMTAAEAADYLVGVAARADGRVGRDAIFAALLGPALVAIATNESDVQGIRQQALQVLARLDHGAGIQPLVQLASGNLNSWIGRESMSVLARSGDPRARAFLRSTVQRTDLSDEVLAAALQGLGREYVTGQDANLLRSIFPRLTGQRSQSAVLSALANLGGTENTQWLTGLVRNDKLSPEVRRRALESLSRAGVPPQTLVALYDPTPDTQLRGMLISVYSRLSDKSSTDKLLWIARNEQNQSLRRRAISALSRNSDPVVRQAMAEIVER